MPQCRKGNALDVCSGDFRPAVQQGVNLATENERLRSAMNRVTTSSADSDGGGWAIRGPRR